MVQQPESLKRLNSDSRQAESFWKQKLVECMTSVSPGFVIDARNRRELDALYRWVWERAGRIMNRIYNQLLLNIL